MAAPRFVFMGSPAFSVPALQALLTYAEKAGGEVAAVFSQPDRASGRGQKITACPVAAQARSLGIPLYQPRSLRKGPDAAEAQQVLKKVAPELIVVVAYGLLLPREVLTIPPKGCINVHASLLPRYRGAAPIQWAIADGEPKTGVTTMLMEEGLDTGPMLMQRETEISATDTAEDLFTRLATLGAEVLLETLPPWRSGTLAAEPQRDSLATHARLLTKEDAWVDWSLPAQTIHCRQRGFYPWPGCQTALEDLVIKIHRAHVEKESTKGVAPGTILAAGDEGIRVASGEPNQVLVLTEVQAPSEQRLAAAEFLRRHAVLPGQRLGTPR